MVLVAVGLHARRYVHYLAIHPNIQIALAPKRLEQFPIVSLTLSYEWRKDIDAVSGILRIDHVENTLLGILHHLFARSIAVCRSGTGKEQSQIVVYLGRSAHG